MNAKWKALQTFTIAFKEGKIFIPKHKPDDNFVALANNGIKLLNI